jgi:hypothetical protein
LKIKFNRTSLYEDVWSQPITRVAERYGLSDYAFRKLCKAVAIPLPAIGHWAKVAAGNAVPRPPLPPAADRDGFPAEAYAVASDYGLPEDEIWLAARLAFDRDPNNEIVCDGAPRRWHPIAVVWRRELRENAKKLIGSRRAAQHEDRLPGRRQGYSAASYDWRWHVKAGQRFPSTHSACAFRVSLDTYERALRILNSLAWAAQRRGFTIQDDRKVGRILLRGYVAEIKLRITERQRQEIRQEISHDGNKVQVKLKVPDGRLDVHLDYRWSSEVAVGDAASEPLESKLEDVFKAAYRFVIRTWQQQRRADERDRAHREEALRREAEEDRQQQEARLAEARQLQKEELIAEATAWRQAELVRDYLCHIDASASQQPSTMTGPMLAAWRSWASAVADELDPTGRRVDSQEGAEAP